MNTELQAISTDGLQRPIRRFEAILAARRTARPRLTISQFVAHYGTTRDINRETVRQYRIAAERF